MFLVVGVFGGCVFLLLLCLSRVMCYGVGLVVVCVDVVVCVCWLCGCLFCMIWFSIACLCLLFVCLLCCCTCWLCGCFK